MKSNYCDLPYRVDLENVTDSNIEILQSSSYKSLTVAKRNAMKLSKSKQFTSAQSYDNRGECGFARVVVFGEVEDNHIYTAFYENGKCTYESFG